jgi:hypothetical protein
MKIALVEGQVAYAFTVTASLSSVAQTYHIDVHFILG